MTIERSYQPHPTAMEELVEVLYALLLDEPSCAGGHGDLNAAALPELACLLTDSE